MSAAVRKWAARQRIEDRTLTSILGVLADAADRDGRVTIGQGEIAMRCFMSERSIRYGLRHLANCGVIERTARGAKKGAGREPDLIHLTITRDFDLSKAAIAEAKSAGCPNMDYRQDGSGCPNGHNRQILPDESSAPRSKDRDRLYKERARASSSNVDGLNSTCGARGRVWFERGEWRARLTYEGLELDLGRHECKELAEAECRVRILDVEHSLTTKSGIPREPALRPDLEKLNGITLCRWLKSDPKDDAKRDGREADSRGVEGTSSLAGFGAEPHGQEA